MSEKFSLKWNDFHSNVSKSFSLLRNEDYLHDVTLVSDDHKKVSAHKLVLSASSEYFRDIFKNNQHSHPLICLGRVSNEDLQNIMDYIYNGEVQIFQENLERFLGVAKRLKLEGLIGGKQEEYEVEMDNKDFVDTFIPSLAKTPSKPIPSNRPILKSVKKEMSSRLNNAVSVALAAKVVDEQVNQYLEECSDGTCRCSVCGKTFSRKQDTQRHIETHIDGLSYECPVCGKTFRSKNSLKTHKSAFHR